ncbi:transposase family protein [Okeania sp. SIO2C9]
MTTFQLLGIQFGVSETTANDTFNYWWPIIGYLLPKNCGLKPPLLRG